MNPFEIQKSKKQRRSILRSDNQKSKFIKQGKTTVQNVQRNLALLSELRNEGGKKGFVDLRRRENSGKFSETEIAAERFKKLKLLKSLSRTSRKSFALSNLSDSTNRTHSLSDSDLTLTHGGKGISEIPDSELARGDIVEGDLIGDEEFQESVGAEFNFTGDRSLNNTNTKSRKEIYEEIIAKSRASRVLRQREKEEQEELLEKLNLDYKGIRELLIYKPTKQLEPRRSEVSNSFNSSSCDIKNQTKHLDKNENCDDYDDYNKIFRSLQCGSTTRPTDRIKNSAEKAVDRLIRLEAIQKARERLDQREIDCRAETGESQLSIDNQASQSQEAEEEEEGEEEEEEEEEEVEKEEMEESEDDSSVGDAFELFNAEVDDDDIEEEKKTNSKSNAAEREIEVYDGVFKRTIEFSVEKSEKKESRENNVKCMQLETDSETRGKELPDLLLTETSEDREEEDELRPEWLIENDSDCERHPKYELPFPNSLEEFKEIFSGEKPKSQWKLLQRLRVGLHPSICSNFKLKQCSLLKLLLQYLENLLILEFSCCDLTKNFTFTVEDSSVTKRYSAFQIMEALHEHLVSLAEETCNFNILVDFLMSRLIKACFRIGGKKIIKELKNSKVFISWQQQQEMMMSSDKSALAVAATLSVINEADVHYTKVEKASGNKPTGDDLSIIFMVVTIFGSCSNDSLLLSNGILTTARLLLDTWSSDVCRMASASFNPATSNSKREELISVGIGKALQVDNSEDDTQTGALLSTDEEMNKKLPEVSVENINLGLVLLGLQLTLFELSLKYSSVILPLSIGLLFSISTLSVPFNNEKEIQQQKKLVFYLLTAIKTILNGIHSSTGLLVSDVLILNVILPTTTALRNKILHPSIHELISSFHNEMVILVNQPMLPLQFASQKLHGIRMFTPRFADPNTESGKSFFNRKGIPEEKLKIKKLKRAAKDARKGAARQLRRDAEFVGAVQAMDKQKRDRKLELGYKRFLKALEQDKEEIHKLKTSGGGIDTSLKAYYANKKVKKQQRKFKGRNSQRNS